MTRVTEPSRAPGPALGSRNGGDGQPRLETARHRPTPHPCSPHNVAEDPARRPLSVPVRRLGVRGAVLVPARVRPSLRRHEPRDTPSRRPCQHLHPAAVVHAARRLSRPAPRRDRTALPGRPAGPHRACRTRRRADRMPAVPPLSVASAAHSGSSRVGEKNRGTSCAVISRLNHGAPGRAGDGPGPSLPRSQLIAFRTEDKNPRASAGRLLPPAQPSRCTARDDELRREGCRRRRPPQGTGSSRAVRGVERASDRSSVSGRSLNAPSCSTPTARRTLRQIASSAAHFGCPMGQCNLVSWL